MGWIKLPECHGICQGTCSWLWQVRNSYLSHRIIDSFPQILKWKIIRLKLAYRFRRQELTKMISILLFLFWYSWKIVCNTMLYMIFLVWLRTGSNPAGINRFRSHTGKTLLWNVPNNAQILTAYQGTNNITQWSQNFLIVYKFI